MVQAIMEASYDSTSDVLCLRLADAPVTLDVSYGWNVGVGYDTNGQLVEITIIDVSSLLAAAGEDDERAMVLTERESRRLLALLDNPPPPHDHFVRAMARRREILLEQEPSIENDGYAWLNRQRDIVRTGRLNEVQAELLAKYFETQARQQLSDLCAILRRILIDLRKLEVDSLDRVVTDQLAESRKRAVKELLHSPSLRRVAEASLETVWQQARRSFLDDLPERDRAGVPEHCPYSMEEILGEAVP